MEVEEFLWLILSCLSVWIYREDGSSSWAVWLVFGRSLWVTIFPNKSFNHRPWRPQQPKKEENYNLLQGSAMSVVLVPTLLQAMAHSNPHWKVYANYTALFALPMPLLVLVATTATAWNSTSSKSDSGADGDYAEELFTTCTVGFLFLGYFLENLIIATTISKALTFGETRVIISLVAILIWEWMAHLSTNLACSNFDVGDEDGIASNVSHTRVSLSGAIGCFLTCTFVSLLVRQKKLIFPLWGRIFLLVIGPLCMVEVDLWRQEQIRSTMKTLSFPRCLNWLAEFLHDSEPTSSHFRYFGLLYWVLVLAISTIPTIQLTRSQQSTVLTRKWFHFVAVLLFGPITFQFPQLLSLSYAIAFCGLMVLETLRCDVPGIQQFYMALVDPTKDDTEGFILSHMGLIVGCAAPLWIAEGIVTGQESSTLLAQWGVLCLGIGDAMGAIVGKSIGRNRWGKNRRTVEGSSAMWLSMMLVGLWFSDTWVFPVATTFVTILEAFTLQMDNLVLPLAGSTIILLLRYRQ